MATDYANSKMWRYANSQMRRERNYLISLLDRISADMKSDAVAFDDAWEALDEYANWKQQPIALSTRMDPRAGVRDLIVAAGYDPLRVDAETCLPWLDESGTVDGVEFRYHVADRVELVAIGSARRDRISSKD